MQNRPRICGRTLAGVAIVLFAITIALGQQITDVLSSPVPEALRFENGKPVQSGEDWNARRAEIMNLFATQVYGRTPRYTARLAVLSERGLAFGKGAIRKQVNLEFSQAEETRVIHVLIYRPAKAKGIVPVIEGLNFSGNQTVAADPGIALNDVWIRNPSAPVSGTNDERSQLVKRQATEKSRGKAASQWQVEKILARGYAFATAYYGDIEPDFARGMRYGIRALLLAPGQTEFGPDQWGALGAWAWGMSRIADYLQSGPAADFGIDGKRIVLFGFSRLGKAALWAAAQDQRFGLVLSNESGVGGAGLYRTKTGETIEHLNTAFPHWFSVNFHRYTGHPDRVPVDGNLLLSLIAPRPLYVGSAEDDHSSCPPAEFLDTFLASKVYRLLGKRGIDSDRMPPVNHPIMAPDVAYHVRSGKHDVTEFDWEQYLAFVDQHFAKN